MKHFIYVLVVGGREQSTPLVHLCVREGTYPLFVQAAVQYLDPTLALAEYRLKRYVLHCMRDETRAFAFLALTTVYVRTEFVYALLGEMKARFAAELGGGRPFVSRPCVRFELQRCWERYVWNVVAWYGEHEENFINDASELHAAVASLPVLELAALKSDARCRKVAFLVEKPFVLASAGAEMTAMTRDLKLSNLAAAPSWPVRHPYMFISIFIVLAVAVFVYVVIVIPLCGWDLNKRANGQRVCIINF